MTDKVELLERKRICDMKIAKLRAGLQEAQADARINGRYMQPKQYAQLQLDIKMLAQRSQSIQNEISSLKKNRISNINDCFRDAAAKILPEKTFLLILDAAHDIQRARNII